MPAARPAAQPPQQTHAALPSADDYQRAVSTPQVSFADAELQKGVARPNKWGLPAVWSGQFAVVFRMEAPAGPRAVRCFTAQVSDHQARYAALHAHLRGQSAPMLADFAYLPKGIRMQGEWRPIVKMEWVEGLPLDRAVEEAAEANDRARLAALAEAWAETMRGLQRTGVTHGDLQHENILVRSEAGGVRMRLVDYDGVYVPALGGRPALESGHPHYQHPARARGEYGAHLDRFPALLILLSLRALAVEPKLWRRYHTDKHLILRSDDLRVPYQSPLLLELTRSPADEVRRLTLELVQACGQPPAQVQLPTELAASGGPVPAARGGRVARGAAAPAAPVTAAPADVDWRRTWSSRGVASEAAVAPVAERPETPAAARSWWLRVWEAAGAPLAPTGTGASQRAAAGSTQQGVARVQGASRGAIASAIESVGAAGARVWAALLRAEPAPPSPPGVTLLLALTTALLAAGLMGALGASGFGELATMQGAYGRQALVSFVLGVLAPALFVSTRRLGAAVGVHALALLLLLGASRPGWSPLAYAALSTLAAAAPFWPVRDAQVTPRTALVSALLAMVARAATAALLWNESGSATLVLVEVGAAVAAGLLAVGSGAGLRALTAWLQAAFARAP